MNDLARTVEALLFLSAEPVSVERLADACEVSEGEIVEALARLREHYAEGFRGVVLREVAESAYDPTRLAEALGGLLVVPPPIDLRHVRRPAVSVEQRLRHLRDLLSRRAPFTFDEAVEGVDRLTEAVTLFALLELYKAGEAKWEQEVPFGPITVVPS